MIESSPITHDYPALYAFPNSTTLTKSHYEHLLRLVSPQRSSRATRFLRFEDSCRTVIAELLLRYALKHSSGIDLHAVTIIENEWKKPFIQGHDLHFNLTHSGDWVMCTIDINEIGVDVEKTKKVDYGIVPRFFSPREQAIFATCTSDQERLTMFTTIWVLKESYIKAIGRGLYCPLDSFSTLPDLSGSTVTLELNDPSLPHKHFKLYDIGEEYRCAVCCSENRFPEVITMVSVESLTS